MITSKPNETVDMILQHQVHMAQIPVKLPLDCKVVYQALDTVAMHNRSVPGLALTSVGALTALEPDYFWKKSEQRRVECESHGCR